MTLAIRKVLGLATVQDFGRVGFAAQAVPRGGALVRALARRANDALENDEHAACVEIFGRLVASCERDVRVATEDGVVRELRAGTELTIDPAPSQRVRYLAIEGGVSAPRILESRSTLATCGIGRALRAGDVVSASEELRLPRSTSRTTAPSEFEAAGPVRIIGGPDRSEVLPRLGEVLARATWRISASSDRIGTRLEGERIAATIATDSLASSPMVVGAIQLPPSGLPIVIGPDGPTTGGYAIIAVIARSDLDRFHARALGAQIAFEIS